MTDWTVRADLLGFSRAAAAAAEGFEAWQAGRSALGEALLQVGGGGFGRALLQAGRLSLGTSAQMVQAGRASIAGDGAALIQAGRLMLEADNRILLMQANRLTLSEVETAHLSISYDIVLDGVSIKDRLTRAEIAMREDAVFDDLVLESIDPDLFAAADPAFRRGQARITVTAGSRTFRFLLEERSGSEDGFELWGRSPAATLDAPFAAQAVFSLEAPTSAGQVAADLADGVSLTWEAEDWMVPADFEFEGYPIEGLRMLAEEIGAVVRTEDDGSLRVRNRFPVRPVHMQAAEPDVRYDRHANLVELSVSKTPGADWNRMQVTGWADRAETPLMEIESDGTGSPAEGEDVFVRVYWTGRKPAVSPAHYETSGAAVFLGEYTEDLEELVEFRDGSGRVSKPVTDFSYATWIGDPAPGADWTPHAFELRLQGAAEPMSTRYRVARIGYRATYWRYRVRGPAVERLLMVLATPMRPDVTVVVTMGAGDAEAPPVAAGLLTTTAAAAARGMAELDRSRYDVKILQLLAPYDAAVRDGRIVDVEDGQLAVTGRCHVREARILFDGPMVWNRLELIRCLV